MRAEWREFWGSTLQYLTLDGTLSAVAEIWPEWLDEVVMFAAAMLAVLLIIVVLMPVSLAIMLYRTPRRVRWALDEIRRNDEVS